MKQKKKNKKTGETLAGIFDNVLTAAKVNAVAGDELGKYLMAVIGEIGKMTTNITAEINETLAALDKEMEGKRTIDATPEALRLGSRAAALSWVADQISGMFNRLKERKNETIH